MGSTHGAKAANIVGAIANEAGLDSRYIGRVDIFDTHTVLDLPSGMPKELMEHLKKVWVAGQQLKISFADEEGGAVKAARKPVKKAMSIGDDDEEDIGFGGDFLGEPKKPAKPSFLSADTKVKKPKVSKGK